MESFSSSANTLLIENLLLRNEMIQFYIKSAGVGVLVLGLIIHAITAIMPAAFTVKTSVPTIMCNFLQDYTSLFQEKKSLLLVEKLPNSGGGNLEWLVCIYNVHKLEIFLKTEFDLGYQKASMYVSKLQLDFGIMIASTNQPQLMVNKKLRLV